MNNQGLEALAALASAAPAPSTTEDGDAKTSENENNGSGGEAPQSSPEATAANAAASSTASTTTTAATNLPSHLVSSSALQSSQQQQQLQHQLTALGQQQFGSGSLGAGQALAAAAGVAPELALLQQLQRSSSDPAVALAMQNMAYYQLMMQSQQQQQPAQNSTTAAAASHLASLLGMGQSTQGSNRSILTASQPAETPAAAPSISPQHTRLLYGGNSTASAPAPTSSAGASSAMPPPPPSAPSSPAAAPPPMAAAPSRAGPGPSYPRSLLAPNPSTSSTHTARSSTPKEHLTEDEDGDSYHADDKKELKRAANRRSAQLSRKRKKQFIEELKDENDDLRRKEQILKSIPDLVLVFDSTGKLWFVSQSISRFVKFKAEELEGKSFWDRLCPESVRLLKAAFMDSLAARESHTDTVPLGNGLWDLRLVDSDGSFVTVTLNGVVHFAGERPECVCCIRPKESSSGQVARPAAAEPADSVASQRQGVVSDVSTKASAADAAAGKAAKGGGGETGNNNDDDEAARGKVVLGSDGVAVRISDSGNSSGESESGSSDELNGRA